MTGPQLSGVAKQLPRLLCLQQVRIPVLRFGNIGEAIRVTLAALLSGLVVVHGQDGLSARCGHGGLDAVDALLVGDAADAAIHGVVPGRQREALPQ